MKSKTKIYLVAILLGSLFISLLAKEQKDEKAEATEEKMLKSEEAKQNREKDIEGWALGCAAMLTERNHDSHILLGGCSVNKMGIYKKKGLLSKFWEINSRDDLLDNLRWIDNGGGRKRFEGWGGLLQTLSEEEYQKLLERYKDNQEILQEIRIAKKYYKKLGVKSLLGWDYTRYICLCRWSYIAGYIDEEEAWSKIMLVAKGLQKTFDSWEDLGQNYLIGRQFWSYEETKKNGYLYEDAYQRLLDMPSSPWNRYPWDMDLTETESISEPDEAEPKRLVHSDYTNIRGRVKS